MTVTLAKGANLLLADEAPGIEQVRIGIGWSAAPGQAAVEVDGVISLGLGQAPGGQLLLAHQVPNPEESVGAPAPHGPVVGDAEKLVVTLGAVPATVTRILFGLAIFDAAARRQTFRSVRDAYVRVLNHVNGIELARYTLTVETGTETAMVLGELYRNPRGWKFRAIGQGYASGLRGVAAVTSGDPPGMRPVDVAGYLRRTSAARSRRTLVEHLHPPAHPQPPPAQPAPPPKPPPPKPPPPKPPPPKPASTAPRTTPSPRREPARSSLDLSESAAPDRGSTEPTATRGAGRSAAPVVFGEHSSRHRQRAESVSVLDENHPVTAWTEADRGSGAMTVTMRWEPLLTATRLPRPSDLQLGCFWQAGDRAAGVMQALGNAMSAPGALGPRQVLRLGRRDEQEGQTIFVDLAALPTFHRFFVVAYGQHGSPEWASLRPALTITSGSDQRLSLRLGDAPPSARLCVMASFHFVQGDLIIRREDDFLDGTLADAAAKYGWAFEWNADGMAVREGP